MADIKQVQIGTTTHDIRDANAVHDTQTNYDNLKTKVDTLAYQNEWIGSYTSTATPPSTAFQTELTNFVKSNTTPSRDPRRGDEVTVVNLNAIYIYNSSSTWVFFSSNQQLSNATTSTAGIVKIGSGINVNNGVISATASTVGARPSNWMPTAAEVGARPSTWTPSKSDIGLGNVDNKSSATIRSEITSANVTTALGYTPYNATNPNGYITASGAPVTSVAGKTGAVTLGKSDVGLGNVGNFKAVSTVANQGLTSTEQSNARTNIGAGTSNFSGNYNDLSNKPTIPTVNNATLTIQKNGSNVATFTANSSTNTTANISVNEVPSGGSTGQVLTKNASGYAWANAASGGSKIIVSATQPTEDCQFWFQVV